MLLRAINEFSNIPRLKKKRRSNIWKTGAFLTLVTIWKRNLDSPIYDSIKNNKVLTSTFNQKGKRSVQLKTIKHLGLHLTRKVKRSV